MVILTTYILILKIQRYSFHTALLLKENSLSYSANSLLVALCPSFSIAVEQK